MAPATIPTTEPTRATAGDTWRWNRSVSGYSPADGWVLTYAFRGKSTLDLTGAANVDNTGWELTADATKTAVMQPGVHRWKAFVTKAGERYTVDEGVTTVDANFALAAAGALQTHAERMLAAIEAKMEGRLTSDMEEYVIAGRQLKRIPFEQLPALRSRYAAEVRRQRNGGRTPQTVACFVRP